MVSHMKVCKQVVDGARDDDETVGSQTRRDAARQYFLCQQCRAKREITALFSFHFNKTRLTSSRPALLSPLAAVSLICTVAAKQTIIVCTLLRNAGFLRTCERRRLSARSNNVRYTLHATHVMAMAIHLGARVKKAKEAKPGARSHDT